MRDYRRTSPGACREVLRARLKEDGYLCLPGLLNPKDVVDVRERCYRRAERAGWAEERKGDRLLADPGFLSQVNAEDYYAVFHSMTSDERLHRLAHHPRLLALIGDLLDLPSDQVLVAPLKVLRWTWPELPTRNAGLHQDFPELQGSLRQLTVWMPFHPVGATTGALPLYRGSHAEGVRELELADNPSGWQARLAAHEVPDVGDLDAGDVLVFTTMTVHGGSVNACNSYRVSMDVRFQPVTDPICESALTLPGYPYTWQEICEDWDPEFARYWERLDLDVVPFDNRWERWREAEALVRGRACDAKALPALRIVESQSMSAEARAEARQLLDKLDSLGG